MKKISRAIAKSRILILIVAIILLIPSAIGYFNTKVNYDILSYLPDDLETREAQKIMKDEFDCGSLAMLIVEGMENKDVAKLKEKVSNVDGVSDVIWIDDALDISVPKEILPSLVRDMLFSDDSTLMIVKLKDTDASESTEKAIKEIRSITGKQAFLSGIGGVIKDTKDLADKETPIYILIAVILSIIILSLTMESFIIPIIFMLSIGIAVAYNMGSNIIFGEISYITKALSAVLQLAVTMDYSIFLLNRYDEECKSQPDKTEAMAVAIEKTIASIAGSSLTTVAGFLALCIMELGFGKDIGFVMAKGVVFGVICTITVLPAMILTFDKLIHKYKHKTLLPKFEKSSAFVIKHHKILVIIGAIILIPAIIGNNNTEVYYNLDESLPKDLPSIVANNKLKSEYNMMSTNIILVRDDLEAYKVDAMIDELKGVDGVTSVVGLEDLLGPRIPQSFIPSDLLEKIKNGGYEEIMLNSEYKAASDEVEVQLKEINNIVKKYDKDGLVGGEAPLTEDLITIADSDFNRVSVASILAIFVIILFVFKSAIIPILLVLAIELAIFINLGIPFYMGTSIPFISSIVIGTIQLGATVDYAILLTSRFKEELALNSDKKKAMTIALQSSSRSIVTSALTFFGATAGVGIISDMEMISSLCTLMARGAIISMVVILFILPGILLLCEKLIVKTSKSFVECVEGGKEI
ncbi:MULTISPECIES: efflux RND transporter permease subunit [Clostridium]|jgi:predicted RND superfamily exporter protein|uniref:efflux RND transporter permease subunit n=1 Tax=Clostridium TaxID=1485 RepID=UPI0004B34DDB|nr:MMPL family transporter [Clostridium saudiense]MDU7453421.1 MMPL family transporter [Clostridium saudiense]SCJ96300.1 Putative membrane protein ydgH [uncultured Clostridium sp.]